MGISLGDSLNLSDDIHLGNSLNFGRGLTGDGEGVVPSGDVLLLESGDKFELENGLGFILLE